MAQAIDHPRVVVVVPAKNEEATIGACLESLLAQTYPAVEVVVVDDGSVDRTREVVRRYPGVKLMESGGGGASRARNIAVAATDAEIVAFTDADCVCREDWVAELVRVLADDSYAGVGGDQACLDDESPFGRKVHGFLKAAGFVGSYVRTTDRQVPTRHNPSCNSAYRREVLEQVGGFDEALWPGEDVDLDHRITSRGHRLAFTPRALVYHRRPRDLRGFVRMMRRYGQAQGYLVRKHGPFRLLHAVPPMFWTGVAVAPLLAPLVPVALAALPWGFFRLRGASAAQAAGYLPLLYGTLLAWNIGFVEELLLGSTACRR